MAEVQETFVPRSAKKSKSAWEISDRPAFQRLFSKAINEAKKVYTEAASMFRPLATSIADMRLLILKDGKPDIEGASFDYREAYRQIRAVWSVTDETGKEDEARTKQLQEANHSTVSYWIRVVLEEKGYGDERARHAARKRAVTADAKGARALTKALEDRGAQVNITEDTAAQIAEVLAPAFGGTPSGEISHEAMLTSAHNMLVQYRQMLDTSPPEKRETPRLLKISTQNLDLCRGIVSTLEELTVAKKTA